MMNSPQSFMPPPPAQMMMPPAVQPLMMNTLPPIANGVFTEEMIETVLEHQIEEAAREAAAEEIVEVEAPVEMIQAPVIETVEETVVTTSEQNLLTEWSIEEAFSDVIPEAFAMPNEPEVQVVVQQVRPEGAVAAPLDSMDEDFNELSLIAGSIEQKIDEALDLAESLGSNMQVGQASDQDDLDIPAFLRMGASNLPEQKS